MSILVALFVVVTLFLLATVSERQAVLRRVVHHDDAWAVSKTVQEVLRLESELLEHVLLEKLHQDSDLGLRIDIVTSRLSSIRDGAVHDFFNDAPERWSVVDELNTVVADIEQNLAEGSRDGLFADFGRLNSLVGPITRLSSQAVQYSWREVEATLKELESLHQIFTVVIISLIVGWCGLLYILLRRNILLAKSQRQTKLLNEDLVATGVTLQRTNKDLEYAANHDLLTGLPNRGMLWRCLEAKLRELRSGEEVIGLLLIDLDDFKSVNDTLGHDTGDALLKQVSDRLQSLKPQPHMFCRLGGDEFACVLIGTTPEDAVRHGSLIAATISEPYHIHRRQIRIGCSVGVVTTSAEVDALDLQTLFKRADMALYCAKASTDDRVCVFEDAMEVDFNDRKSLEHDLLHAIREGAIDVHYQMQFDVHSLELRGMEALARWYHPKHGFIPPVKFITVAEEIGAIFDLGGLILRKACEQAAKWDVPAKIAVNVSPLQLQTFDFLDLVVEVLSDTGLAAARLEIEVTETALADGQDVLLQVLTKLRSFGVSVAIDDFGTGYSSLARLRTVPFDTIKLDRSFLTDITVDPKASEFLKIVSDLGSLLRKEVIIEGIETIEEHSVVRGLHCDVAQGFLFARPLPENQLSGVRTFPSQLVRTI